MFSHGGYSSIEEGAIPQAASTGSGARSESISHGRKMVENATVDDARPPFTVASRTTRIEDGSRAAKDTELPPSRRAGLSPF